MATYVLQNSAQQIDQAVTAAYSGLVLGGTGLARTTGNQTISGIKTFVDQIVFSSGAILNGPTQLNNIGAITPTGNSIVDLGSASNRFKTGWFSGISGVNAIIRNLTVLDNLTAPLIGLQLINSTGINVTLSGTTNLNNANFSGNINSAGTNTFSGDLNVSGNSILNGTVTATGNKTFSGAFSQTGNSSFFGNFAQSGTLFSTGTWNHTGNFNQTGSSAFLGSVSINSSNAAFDFFGNNSNFNITSNLGVNGVVNITGDCNITGAQHTIGGRSRFLNGITLSGNLETNPIGGTVEYGNDGRFYLTNQTAYAPNRALLNPTYSIIAPSDSNTIALASTGIFYPMLNNTGIYLTTGTYHFFYNVNFGNAGTPNYIRMGLFSSGNAVFNKRHGLAYQRFDMAGSLIGYGSNINGSGYSLGTTNLFGTTMVDQTYVYSGPSADGYSLYIHTNAPTKLNNFLFDCVVTLTGNAKVFPVLNLHTAPIGNITIREFNMRVTQLTTGAGLGLTSASGPWSNA
jgi:hypothetical protein